MSAVAANSTLNRSVRFYGTTIGKKAIMAITGIFLFGFLVAHMAGNLQFFLGPDALNSYAEKLRETPALLWGVRLGLLVTLILHVVASIQLVRTHRVARPVGYARKDNVGSTYASRTMYWSGPIVAAFVVYHLMHLTLGIGGLPFEELRPYDNVVAGFSKPLVTVAYGIAVTLLGMHLYHGLWSLFQSLGFSHPRYTPRLRLFAKLFAIFIVLGFMIVPVSVLLGFRPGSTML